MAVLVLDGTKGGRERKKDRKKKEESKKASMEVSLSYFIYHKSPNCGSVLQPRRRAGRAAPRGIR